MSYVTLHENNSLTSRSFWKKRLFVHANLQLLDCRQGISMRKCSHRFRIT